MRSRRPCSAQHGPHSECILWWPSSNHQLSGDSSNTMSQVYRDFSDHPVDWMYYSFFLSTWFEAWLSRRWATATVFTATAIVISMAMLPMSLVMSPVPTVFLSATTSMLLPMFLKPYRKPTLSCRRSQETLQFLPSSLLQPFPLPTAATATTPITQLQQRTTVPNSSKWHNSSK